MTFLKSLYRKLFGIKTGVYVSAAVYEESAGEFVEYYNREYPKKNSRLKQLLSRPAYDPSQDENKIMNGEVESYFD